MIFEFHAGIVDIESCVCLGSFHAEIPVCIGLLVAGAGEEHHRSSFEWIAVHIGYMTFYEVLLNNRNVIVADLAFDDLYRVVSLAKNSYIECQRTKNEFWDYRFQNNLRYL